MLCAACQEELHQRLQEKQPGEETPIEFYARRGRMPPQPCTYDLNSKKRSTSITAPCGRTCDPGELMCPRHKVVAQVEKQAAAAKELAKEVAKRDKAKNKGAAGSTAKRPPAGKQKPQTPVAESGA